MASKAKSRWADDEQDAELEAQRRKEKEEKKRLKAEKAKKLEAEKQAREAAEAAATTRRHPSPSPPETNSGHPAKRRKLSPERGTTTTQTQSSTTIANGTGEKTHKLLRFDGGAFRKARSVENYDKLNDIEEGSYGWVSRARDISTGEVVALKRLKLNPKDRGGVPVTGLREIQVLKACDHRNIVHLKEIVVNDDTSRLESIFLVMEFLEHDLKSILEDMPNPFLQSEIKTLLLQLAAGTAYLHENWILHRDLKTSNLLLNNRGQLKIADFGMARFVGDPPPQKLTQLVVTLWYRSPELLLGTPTYNTAVDTWSIGCIFGELLTREPLLQGKNEVDQLTKIFELCGIPTEETWPGFRRLPNAKGLRLPQNSTTTNSLVRARFPTLPSAGAALLNSLLALDPEKRPSAKQILAHEYFKQDPKPKQEAFFPTYPSKAGQERRRKRETPNAPLRGEKAVDLGHVDFSGIFAGREKEERGAGFALRMV
ncbi:kinase-like domain-containing protein [Podospora australis]|uniref:cyclin-dependent kinase n=1 Tax=Podospora australis TaxID=1536484 RepID=A0AAN6X5V4_9PEZI|nr:kinase-like domain-containing protein [Podospora australis]